MSGTTHSVHPSSHAFGLADGCPRCLEHAEKPFQDLDDTNLARLSYRIEDGLPARSLNEGIAMRHVRDLMNKSARLTQARLVTHRPTESRNDPESR